MRDATDGAGSVVLVLGEAGIGKSSLVRALPGLLPPGARLLVGQCDDLATGRPLGPLRDFVGSVGAGAARRGRPAPGPRGAARRTGRWPAPRRAGRGGRALGRRGILGGASLPTARSGNTSASA
ncbi:AAA family ATPase [Streptomyces sp. NBC_01361]